MLSVWTIYSAQLKSIDTFDNSLETFNISSLWLLNLSSLNISQSFGRILQLSNRPYESSTLARFLKVPDIYTNIIDYLFWFFPNTKVFCKAFDNTEII